MALNGIHTLLYAVEDVAESTRFFEDFGLIILEKSTQHAHFRLPNGSNVVVRHLSDPAVPKSEMVGRGVHECIWGVDSEDALARLVTDLSRDHTLRTDADGTVHFVTDFGLAVGLKVWCPLPVHSASSPVNEPGVVRRLNESRKWILRAHPKSIDHVVWAFPDNMKAWAFFRDRLNFKLTDKQGPFGCYARCDGVVEHHSMFFLNGNLPFPGMDGKLRFNHANYAVEDLDELMIGSNHMEARGWKEWRNDGTAMDWGLGRHRISSALYHYWASPAGGDAEYGADCDCVDDRWVPRDFEPRFGTAIFMHNRPEFMKGPIPWRVEFVPEYVPAAPEKKEGH
jgi:hypothetical protein